MRHSYLRHWKDALKCSFFDLLVLKYQKISPSPRFARAFYCQFYFKKSIILPKYQLLWRKGAREGVDERWKIGNFSYNKSAKFWFAPPKPNDLDPLLLLSQRSNMARKLFDKHFEPSTQLFSREGSECVFPSQFFSSFAWWK